MTGELPDEAWATVVRNVPLVSVDLVVRHDGGVVLGERTNAPAAGEWFTPGGVVRRGERLAAAVRRVGREALGVDVSIVRRLGVYEHFWDVADVPDADGTHYVPVGHLVDAEAGAFEPDAQHAALRVFRPPFDDVDLHPSVEAYLRDAGFLEAE